MINTATTPSPDTGRTYLFEGEFIAVFGQLSMCMHMHMDKESLIGDMILIGYLFII
jgi:hypothetical protein